MDPTCLLAEDPGLKPTCRLETSAFVQVPVAKFHGTVRTDRKQRLLMQSKSVL